MIKFSVARKNECWTWTSFVMEMKGFIHMIDVIAMMRLRAIWVNIFWNYKCCSCTDLPTLYWNAPNIGNWPSLSTSWSLCSSTFLHSKASFKFKGQYLSQDRSPLPPCSDTCLRHRHQRHALRVNLHQDHLACPLKNHSG